MQPRAADTTDLHDRGPVEIAGAGPAGLAAAITLARAGYPVIVHEAQAEVGHRFGGDIQGLENWSSGGDVLAELAALGLSTDFTHHPCSQGQSYDAWGRAYRVHSPAPLLYLVKRGPAPGSLDSTLLHQALSLGVEVRFNSRITNSDTSGLVATGPEKPFAVALGYHFETDMENGFWVICDNNLAPKGYAYLVVLNGHGTLKSCIFDEVKEKKHYVQRSVSAFERLLGLQMINPRPHGGVVNAAPPISALRHGHPLAGEVAGFQDSLWGFGMRIAIKSGVLAARSLSDGLDYDTLWQGELAPLLRSSQINRALYAALGNHGYRWYLGHLQRQADARRFLLRQYRPSLLKRALFPLLRHPA